MLIISCNGKEIYSKSEFSSEPDLFVDNNKNFTLDGKQYHIDDYVFWESVYPEPFGISWIVSEIKDSNG